MVVLHDFTGIYDEEDFYKNMDHVVIREREIEGTHGYLDKQAEETLLMQIRNESLLPSVHFLDSGNYHYMSRLYAGMLKEKYILVVYDNHTDMQPSAFGDILSCGSWIADIYEDGKAGLIIPPEKIIIVGASHKYIEECQYKDAPGIIFTDSIMTVALSELTSSNNIPVYLSVDKDVLSKSEFESDWDQGSMSLDTLIREIRFISTCGIYGADVCGEPQPENGSYKKSSRINYEIIKALGIA